MSLDKPSYYAVIPAHVRYSQIKPNAKLLYGEITALCNEKGYCWASNDHFAKLYGVSAKQVSLWVKQLIDNNFIKVESIKSRSGTLRKLYLAELAHYQKVKGTLPKGNVLNRGSTLPKGNTNIKLNNKENKRSVDKFKTPRQMGMPDLGGY